MCSHSLKCPMRGSYDLPVLQYHEEYHAKFPWYSKHGNDQHDMHIKTLLCLHDNNRSRPQPRLFSRVQNSTVEKLNVHFAGPFHTSFTEEKGLVEIYTVDSNQPRVRHQQILTGVVFNPAPAYAYKLSGRIESLTLFKKNYKMIK